MLNKIFKVIRSSHLFWRSQFGVSKVGFSLIEVLVAASILGILWYAIASLSGSAFQVASISNRRQDLASLKMVIRDQVNCALTLGLPVDYDFSVPVACAGPYLLKKKSGAGASQIGASISGDPQRTLLGNYKLRASCVANQLQVMVESTRKDPITKTILPPQDLFAAAGGNGFCSQYFTGASCPAGQSVIGIANGTPVCSTNPPVKIFSGSWSREGLYCPSGWDPFPFCDSVIRRNVTFPTPFTNIPSVIVTNSASIDRSLVPCAGGAIDQVNGWAENITTTGFQMVCSSSPFGSSCYPYANMQAPSLCNWLAVGR